MHAVGAGLAFVERWRAVGIHIAVALLWFAPDRRVEEQVEKAPEEEGMGGSDP